MFFSPSPTRGDIPQQLKRAKRTWLARAMAALGSAGLAMGVTLVTPATASASASAAPYCNKIAASQVSTDAGTLLVLANEAVVGKALVCNFQVGETIVSLAEYVGLNHTQQTSLKDTEKAESGVYGSGVTIKFSALRFLGRTGYSWTFTRAGFHWSGVAGAKGAHGFWAMANFKLSQGKLTELLKLAMSA